MSSKITKTEKQHETSIVPKLRFPEFRDSEQWVKEAFGDLYQFHPTNSLSRDRLSYDSGSIRNIHYGDIHTKFAPLFDITKENVPCIDPSASLPGLRPDSFCVEGDLIFADASEDEEGVGKSIEIVNLDSERLLSGDTTCDCCSCWSEQRRRIKCPLTISHFSAKCLKTSLHFSELLNSATSLQQIGIDEPDRIANIVNTLSHKKIYYYESDQLVPDNRAIFDDILEGLKQKYSFVLHAD
jgi:hypothetical protein